jgi:hypothetical protein
LSSTRRHSVASHSAIAAPLLHGQSPQTLRGQVLVPGVDLGDLRPKIWLSSCVWAFSRHSPSADRGSGSPKTTSAGSRGVDLCAGGGSSWKRSQYCCRWRGASLTALGSGPASHRCYLAFRVGCGEETTAHRVPSFQELSWSPALILVVDEASAENRKRQRCAFSRRGLRKNPSVFKGY